MDFKTYISEKKEEQPKDKHAVLWWGRSNPITKGHEAGFNKTIETAREVGGDAHIITSHSQGKKDPLPQNKKIEYIKKVVGKAAKVSGSSSSSPSIFHHASNLHKQGYNLLTMVAGSDRANEYKKQIQKYNGKEGKHGFYKFKKINVVSAGERDPDAEDGLSGISGTKAREAAMAGNHEEFKRMLPDALHPHAYEIANHIRSNLKEEKDSMAIQYKLKEAKLPVLLMTKEQLEEKMGIKFISESTLSNLKIKSEKSNISFEIIKEIYKRGVDSHIEEASNITPHQLGMARVNSYLMKGKSFNELDSDLREQEKQDEELTLSEEDMDKIVHDLTWEDIVDLYPESDLVEDDEEELNEVLTAQGRIKKRQSFARFKGRRGVAKGIKLRRASDNATLQRRARLAARRAIYKRFLKGRDKSQMSASEKAQIEAQVARLKIIQNTLAQRLVPKIRSIEQKRIASYRTKKR